MMKNTLILTRLASNISITNKTWFACANNCSQRQRINNRANGISATRSCFYAWIFANIIEAGQF